MAEASQGQEHWPEHEERRGRLPKGDWKHGTEENWSRNDHLFNIKVRGLRQEVTDLKKK